MNGQSNQQTTDSCLLAREGLPALGMTCCISEGDSKGTEEKDTRNPCWSPGEEQQDGEKMEIQTLFSLNHHVECKLSSKQKMYEHSALVSGQHEYWESSVLYLRDIVEREDTRLCRGASHLVISLSG